MNQAQDGAGRPSRWRNLRLLRWIFRLLRWRRRSVPAWLDLEETGPGPGYSKEALKELIERKRQNDFVRKREFEHLRRLRRREPIASAEPERLTSFQSSLTAADARNRAATIRKINEIEAQMSRQWWKGEKDWAADANGAAAAPRPSGPASMHSPPAHPLVHPAAPQQDMRERSSQGMPMAGPLPSAMAKEGASALLPVVHGSASNPIPGLEGGVVPETSGAASSHSAPHSGDDGHVWNDDADPSVMPVVSGLPETESPPLSDAEETASAWPAVPMPADSGKGTWGAAGQGGLGGGWSGVSSTRSVFTRATPPPAPDHLADPDLEDAAIRYANGDHEGATHSLRTALESALELASRAPPPASVLQALARTAGSGKAPSPQLVETWLLACVDLARATGRKERYDQLAADWVQRYAPIYTHLASSPMPPWFSIPDRVGPGKGAVRLHRPPLPAVRAPDWRSPARLDAAAMQGLLAKVAVMFVPSSAPAVMDESSAALVLDWQALRHIAPEAAPLLAQLITQWCDAPASATLGLVFRGPASLERALLALTHPASHPANAVSRSNPLSWRLRMDALRLMRLRDAFELAALDYGVTYETQAPAWRTPLAFCLLQGPSDPADAEAEDIRANWDALGADAWAGEGLRNASLDREALGTLDVWIGGGASGAGPDGVPSPADAGSAAQPVRVDLYGEIGGDATEVLAKLANAIAGRTHMVVSCTDLIRVDFPAAGGLLNWVTEQQAQGRQVQLRDVHRLVAAFFNVIGISEYARVVPRSD